MNKGILRRISLDQIMWLSVLAVLFISCATAVVIPSKVNVQAVNKVSNATTNALVYALPATVIRVEVMAEKTISKVGPFYRYSQKMLNVKDVVLEDKEEWTLKGVRVYTVGRPDQNRRFVISSSGDNVAPLVNLTPEGIMAGVNLEKVPESPSPFVVEENRYIPGMDDITFDAVSMMENQLNKTSTAAMAEETANFIYKVRKRRFKILAADYPVLPPDGKSYEVSVEELNTLESDFLALFVGKRETFSVTKTIDFVPDSMSVANGVLCRFSTQKGILKPMDLSGTPIYIELDVEHLKQLPDNAVIQSDKEEITQGLYYCLPAKGKVKIIDRNILLLEQEVQLGQYGQLLSLPVSVMEKNNVRIELDPATGALRNISKE